MSQFQIYQSEFGVRMENEQLKAEINALKADNNRLRSMVGEQPIAAELAAKIVPGANGESFKTGNCVVEIKGPGVGANAPVLNPMVARARGGAGKLKNANAPADLPQSTQPRDLEHLEHQPQQQQRVNGVDTDDAALRFSLLEH
jgi:hypothetical protein